MAYPDMKNMQETIRATQSGRTTDDLDLIGFAQEARGGPPPGTGMPQGPMGGLQGPAGMPQGPVGGLQGPAGMPQGLAGMPQRSSQIQKLMDSPNLHKVLNTSPSENRPTVSQKITQWFIEDIAGIDVTSEREPEISGLPLEAAPHILAALQNPEVAAASGGLIGMVSNDRFSGQVPGRGHGMQDNVYMPIVERKAGDQVGRLAVSPDEYVVDAHTMSALGNGSADAGAEVMDRVVGNVRQQAFGTQEQPRQINGLAALRPMVERV